MGSSITCRFGPLIRYWCMRFESKHSYFKDLAHRVKCFKNIAKTMAERHQYLVAYYLNCNSGKSPFYKEPETGVGMYLCACSGVCGIQYVFLFV